MRSPRGWGTWTSREGGRGGSSRGRRGSTGRGQESSRRSSLAWSGSGRGSGGGGSCSRGREGAAGPRRDQGLGTGRAGAAGSKEACRGRRAPRTSSFEASCCRSRRSLTLPRQRGRGRARRGAGRRCRRPGPCAAQNSRTWRRVWNLGRMFGRQRPVSRSVCATAPFPRFSHPRIFIQKQPSPAFSRHFISSLFNPAFWPCIYSS
jgi:hypothetical protein